MDQKLWYIKKTGGLFDNLKDDDLKLLAGMSSMITCQRKYQFYLTDEPSDSIFFVKQGKVRLGRVNLDGDEITLDVLGQGELFGELAAINE